MDTFARAYLTSLPLTAAELWALPDLFRLRETVSLLHRLERYRQADVAAERVAARFRHACWREAWLISAEAEMGHHISRWEALCHAAGA